MALLIKIILVLCVALSVQTKRSMNQTKSLLKYRAHLQQRFISLKHERHRSTQFTSTTLNTEVDRPWSDLPVIPLSSALTLDMIRGVTPCPASIQVTIIKFRKKRRRTMCLFKETFDGSLFEKNMNLDFMQDSLSPEDLFTQTNPVNGFIVNEISSVVKGYIVDKYFYGTIKLFDKFRAYHLHFYVEPIENMVLYSAKYLDATIKRDKNDNAILFEYISHEDYYEKVTPKTESTTELPTSRTTGETKITFSPKIIETVVTDEAIEDFPESDPADIQSISSQSNDPMRSYGEFGGPSDSEPLHEPFHSTEATPSSIVQNFRPYADSPSDSEPQDEPFHSTEATPTSIVQNFRPYADSPSDSEPQDEPFHSTEATPRSIVQNFRPTADSPSNSEPIDEPFHSTEATPKSIVQKSTRKAVYHSTEATPRSIVQKSTRKMIFHSTEATPRSSVDLSHKEMYHSTEATPRPGWKGRERRKRSRDARAKRFTKDEATTIPSKTTIVKLTDERLIFQDLDLVKTVQYKTGMSTSDVFDLRLDQSLLCTLCIWIQPHFAKMFGYNGGMAYGISEIIDIIKTANWYFRAFDFNSDGLADNIGLKIKDIVITDDFKIIPNDTQENKAKSSPFHPLMTNRRKKRSILTSKNTEFASFDIDSYDIDPNLMLQVKDLQYLNEIDDDSQNDAIKLGVPKSSEQKQFSRMIYSIPGKQAYDDITSGMKTDQRFSGCCAVLGFLYHNLAPSMSVSTLRGACSSNNIALVSGALHMHKIGKFDVLRSVMHSLGHLFGSHHDRTISSNCKDNKFSYFINPFLLDPIPQMNVGLRPNSMKMSPCAKIDIALFLSSPNQACLRVDKPSFCGNGWVDEGEDCDCGSPWQCHLENVQCCGERDSVLGCKRVDTADYEAIKSRKCPRPLKW